MRLPITLLTIALLINIIFPSRVTAQENPEPTPEVIGGVDPNDEGTGEEIDRSVTVTVTGNVSPLKIGIENDEFQFPDLKALDNTTTQAMPFLLPKNLLDKFELPDPQKLEGKVFHPICKFDDKPPNPNENLSDDVSEVETPDWWPNTLAVTRLAQAIGVPGFSSWVKFQTEKGEAVLPGEEKNKPLPTCEPVSLTDDEQANPDESEKQTQIHLNPLQQLIEEIIRRILAAFGQATEVPVVAQSKKFVQGQTEFAEQAGREMGFLRAFAPDELLPKSNEFDAKVETPYVENHKEEVAFQGVAGARAGYELLAQSLYPAELQGIISPYPGGAPYPYPGGSDKLDYTIPYMDGNYPISEATKERIIQQVLRSWPNSRIRELWDQVVAQSRAAGVNPAFTIAIWIEESGAGGHALANSDFGCYPGGNTKQKVLFDRSLSCFLHFTSSEHPGDFVEWVRYFCGPNTPSICSNNPNFIRNLKYWWNQVSQ